MPNTPVTDIAAATFAKENAMCKIERSYMPPQQYVVSSVMIYSKSPDNLNVAELNNQIYTKVDKFLNVYQLEYSDSKVFEQKSLGLLRTKLVRILKDLYSLTPKAVALEFTSDESILFTVAKDDSKAYLEFFPLNTQLEVPEFVLNIYRNGEDVVDSFSSGLNVAVDKLKVTLLKSINMYDQPTLNHEPNVLNVPNYTTTPYRIQIY